MDIKDHSENYILWKNGKGLVSFWKDNWTGKGALAKIIQFYNAFKNTKFIQNGN